MKKALPKHPSRTRFAKDIVCEFLAPLKTSNKVIILCTGMPGYPGSTTKAMYTLAARGYWVFVPRYRGSWESGGKFLEKSPHEDVLAVVSGLAKGFVDAWSTTKLAIKNPRVYIIGASFGGGAALLSARDQRVKKVIAIAPVVDWKAQDKTSESLSRMARFVDVGFGNAYRRDKAVWKKLAGGKFYSAAVHTKMIPGKKILVIHAKDDPVVHIDSVQAFAEKTNVQFVALRSGGHLGVSSSIKPHIWRRIEAFLK